MKPIIKIKRLIEKELSAKETYDISIYARELSYEKRKQERIDEVKAIGLGNEVLVAGGSSEMAKFGVGAKIGTIVRYNPKRVSVYIKDCSRPGKWYIPYRYLYPPTEENIKREKKLVELAEMSLPLIGKINKILR